MFGAAVFGSILTRRLAAELSRRLGENASNVNPGALLSGTMRVADVPPEAAEAVRASLASALPTAFLGGLPLMAVGLVAALLLKELPLRTKSHLKEADEQRPSRPQSAVPQAQE